MSERNVRVWYAYSIQRAREYGSKYGDNGVLECGQELRLFLKLAVYLFHKKIIPYFDERYKYDEKNCDFAWLLFSKIQLHDSIGRSVAMSLHGGNTRKWCL